MLLTSMVVAAAIGASLKPTEAEVLPPGTVKVLPIFFVPKDFAEPTADQAQRLMRHVEWTRKRYAELLPGSVTFGVAGKVPMVFLASESLAFYREQPQGGAPRFVDELLRHLKFTRYNCPYILLVVLVNPIDDYPYGGGRPLNGGFSTGGGIVILSSHGLDAAPNFQSTLQHELGHAFGLPHVDVYGFDMASNESLMSYNPGHHTDGFKPARAPGKFVPEDLRGLALNQRVFPNLRFDPKRHVPKGYRLPRQIVGLGPMDLPGQLDRVAVTTPSGGDCTPILNGPEYPGAAWRSEPSPTGRAHVDVTLPVAVTLNKVVVHAGAGTREVYISAVDLSGRAKEVVRAGLPRADVAVDFTATRSRVWRFEFPTRPGGDVEVRGIEYFTAAGQVFPPLVPFERTRARPL